jgi:hypothetical protein
MGLPTDLLVVRPSLIVDGSVGNGGGIVEDDTFGDRASVTFPAGAVSETTSVAIDVFEEPLDIPTPSGFSGPGTLFVNVELTPEPSYPLPPPGLTVVLPLDEPMPPWTPFGQGYRNLWLSLFRVDPATGDLVPALDVNGRPVMGTVDAPDGMSATFTGVASLSTVVGLLMSPTPQQQIEALINVIDDLNLPEKRKSFLVDLLIRTTEKINQIEIQKAVRNLEWFIIHVERFAGTGLLSEDEAQMLLTMTEGIIQSLGYKGLVESIAVAVDIDIRPYSRRNRVRPNRGKVPVAILSTDDFDAQTVNPETVRFGPAGAESRFVFYPLRDVNRDGKLDLVLPFRMRDTGIQCGDTEATLIGETFDGTPLEGADSIKTVGCRKKKKKKK